MSLGHGASVVRDGLVLHLDAANPKSYPGSGTVWSDLSGNGNHGTLYNSPSYISSNSGYFTFDGTNNYATVDGVAPGGNDFTWNIWVVIDNSVQNRYFLDFGSNGGTLSHGTEVGGYGVRYYDPTAGTGSAVYKQGPILEVGIWYNITATRSSGIISLYLNGSFYVSASVSTRNITGTLNIGRYGSNLAYNHDGNFSTIVTYSRSLTPAEIQQNFEALRGRYGI